MKQLEVEMFSETINCPVLRICGRRFPGVLIQGDSLAALTSLAEEVVELSRSGDTENLAAAARMIKDKLSTYLDAYERTMAENSLELPYAKRE